MCQVRSAVTSYRAVAPPPTFLANKLALPARRKQNTHKALYIYVWIDKLGENRKPNITRNSAREATYRYWCLTLCGRRPEEKRLLLLTTTRREDADDKKIIRTMTRFCECMHDYGICSSVGDIAWSVAHTIVVNKPEYNFFRHGVGVTLGELWQNHKRSGVCIEQL